MGEEIAGAKDGGDGIQGAGPKGVRFGRRGAGGFEIERDAEAFLRGGEIEEGGADDALGGCAWQIKRSEAPLQTAEEMLLLVERGEEGAVATEEIEVGDEGGGGLFGLESEVKTEMVALVAGGLPDIALGGEEGRASGVEGAKGVLQGRMGFGLRDEVDSVGIFAEIDKADGTGGVFPGNDKNRIVGGTFGGPVKEHVCLG